MDRISAPYPLLAEYLAERPEVLTDLHSGTLGEYVVRDRPHLAQLFEDSDVRRVVLGDGIGVPLARTPSASWSARNGREAAPTEPRGREAAGSASARPPRRAATAPGGYAGSSGCRALPPLSPGERCEARQPAALASPRARAPRRARSPCRSAWLSGERAYLLAWDRHGRRSRRQPTQGEISKSSKPMLPRTQSPKL